MFLCCVKCSSALAERCCYLALGFAVSASTGALRPLSASIVLSRPASIVAVHSNLPLLTLKTAILPSSSPPQTALLSASAAKHRTQLPKAKSLDNCTAVDGTNCRLEWMVQLQNVLHGMLDKSNYNSALLASATAAKQCTAVRHQQK